MRNLWENTKWSNIYVTVSESQKEKKERIGKKCFLKTMAENFPKL